MTWKCGAASVDFTPDEPFWLAGYASRTAPATGKLSELRAKALALEDARGERALILTVDLIAVQPGPIGNHVLRHVRQRHGLRSEQVLMAASHTHYGPEIRGDKTIFFGIPPEYASKIEFAATRVREAMCHAADQALASMKPARLLARQTTAGFAENRRAAGGVTDHDVPVLEVVGEDQKRLAVLFGYACHNTTIPPEDLRYCGDWAGFAQERIEQANPGCCALFITGAAADQNPHPRGSVELSRRYGDELASAVSKSLQSPGREVGSELRVAHQELALPLEPIDRAKLLENVKSSDPPIARKARFLLDAIERSEALITEYPAPIQAIRFGREVLLIALSGEPVNDYAHHFKQEFKANGLVWVAGYCNDMFGYLPTARIQHEGGYEGGRANLWSWIPMPFDQTVEARMIAGVRGIVTGVSE
jgi:hypothetical protein